MPQKQSSKVSVDLIRPPTDSPRDCASRPNDKLARITYGRRRVRSLNLPAKEESPLC